MFIIVTEREKIRCISIGWKPEVTHVSRWREGVICCIHYLQHRHAKAFKSWLFHIINIWVTYCCIYIISMRLSWIFNHQTESSARASPADLKVALCARQAILITENSDITMSFFNLDRFRFQRDNAVDNHGKSLDEFSSDKENQRGKKNKMPFPAGALFSVTLNNNVC